VTTVADAVAASVAAFGTRDVFGLVGSGNLELANALVFAGVTYHGACHEAGAVAMADGYARVSGAVGMATVHQGPGFTNTLTALTEAVRSRTPLVLLAAESAAGNQALDQVAVAESLGARAVRLRSAADAAAALVQALHERRTVVLNLPLDVQGRRADAATTSFPARPAPRRPRRDELHLLAETLATAKRPVILAGRGALDARDALTRLADSCGALLATTAAAHGLFAGNRRSLGIAGGFSSPLARSLLGTADLVLVFGASLNRWTTCDGRLFPAARVVQVDTERPAPGVSLWVTADARTTAEALTVHSEGFTDALAELAAYNRRDEIADCSTSDRIDPRTLMVVLDDLLPDTRAVAVDSGHFMGWPAMYLTVATPDAFTMAQAFQSVGLGLATAIGASVARRDRITVAVLGDGGARMSLMELDTAVRLGLPLLVVIVNDSGYGAEVHDFEPRGIDVELARFPDVDFAAVARGLGAEGIVVRRRDELDRVRAWAAAPRTPLLLDCKVNPDVAADW
jgi:thiamine pyrophosphate-dependent acetolactate synthase large subunit-like protein